MATNDNLRKNVKFLIIETGYDKIGWQKKLAGELNISPQMLCMSLTGLRNTPRAVEILEEAQQFLRKKL